jgi:hypothetical protein
MRLFGWMMLPEMSVVALTGGKGFTVDGSLVGDLTGALPQAASIPTMNATHHQRKEEDMALLLLEALGAGLIFVGIIWWTMFSGRVNGELPAPQEEERKDKHS